MAWPTPDDILRRLPIDSFEEEDTETKGVTAASVQGYVNDWKEKLRQGSSETPIENDLGRSIVARGALADSLEELMIVQGRDIPRAVESLRREAYRMLSVYAEQTDLPGETGEEAPDEDGDFVHNFTEHPVFDHRSETPEQHLERGRWPYV